MSFEVRGHARYRRHHKDSFIIKLSEEERIILILYLFYTLDVDQHTMQRIVKELGGEHVMPSLAERLIKQGEERGEKRGEKRGERKGAIKGKQELLVKQLRRKFNLTSKEEKTIRSVTDESKLDAAAEAILDAKSKDEVLKILG